MLRYVRFVVKHRFLVLAFIVGATALAGWQMSQGVIASSMHNFLGEFPAYDQYLERIRDFANDEVVIIGFEEPDLLGAESLDRLERTTEQLRRLPDVRRVRSILDAPRIRLEKGSLSLDPYAELARRHPERAAELLDELKSDPLLSGLLVSPDGKNSVVIIEMEPDLDRRAENFPDLVEAVLATFEHNGYDRSRLHRTGDIAVIAEVMRQTDLHISRLFPLVIAALLLCAFVLFRRLWPVFITALTAMIGVVWTMGFSVALFHKINILLAMVPMFIMIVSFSDVVHLCSSYLLEITGGAPKDRAIEKSCSEVGRACLFTSMTTFAGFVSLATVPAPVSRQAGLALGFGVAVSLIVAFTVTPILFSIMPAPKPWRAEGRSRVQDLLDAFLGWAHRQSVSRPRLIVAAFAVLTVVSLIGATRFELEADFVRRFASDNPLMRDERYFSEHFAGTNYLDVFIETPDRDGLLDPGLLAKINQLEHEIRSLPEVDKVFSMVDLLRTIQGEFHPELAAGEPLPTTALQAGQYLFLIEDEPDVESLLDADRRTMRMAVHLKEDGMLATGKAGARVKVLAEGSLGSEAKVEVMGLTYLLGGGFIEIMHDQKRALVLSIVVIWIMMSLALKSIRDGLWSMVPNLIPLLSLVGWLGWKGGKVDTDILMVLMIAIGIGVDDTIHFLIRYRHEQYLGASTAEAVERTFHYSGRAIVITSVILVVGFSPFAISDYFTTHIMGTLLPACLLVALAADLFLVPALIQLGVFPSRDSTPRWTQPPTCNPD